MIPRGTKKAQSKKAQQGNQTLDKPPPLCYLITKEYSFDRMKIAKTEQAMNPLGSWGWAAIAAAEAHDAHLWDSKVFRGCVFLS